MFSFYFNLNQNGRVYHLQTHPTHYTQSSSTRSQAANRNKGKAIGNSPPPTYDQEPEVVVDEESFSKVKEIDKLVALISMSFKKIYKPTNNNLRPLSNTINTNVNNTPITNRGTGFDRQTGQYTQIDINHAADDNLKGLSAEEDHLVGNEVVRVKIPKCMSLLDAYDKTIGDLDIVEDKVDNPNPKSAPQVLLSFVEYTPTVTYSKEVEETLRTPIEVEPLDKTQLEDLGLNTCNHDLPLSSREVPSFDEMKPQPQPLPNCPPLDISLGDKRGLEPPIKPRSPDSFRMKEVDHLTNHTPPSPHVASFHPKDTCSYYHPCIGDLKKHYGFKPSLLGQSGYLGVDFSKLEMIEDDWELESKEASFLGRELNSFVRLKEVEKVVTASCIACDVVFRLCEHKSSRVLVLVRNLVLFYSK
ncbi:hypothetical protein Tco_0434321 [Tanacetum coccineum]